MSKHSKLTSESAIALAQICTVVAIVCGAMPLLGWVIGLPALRNFGSASQAIRPLTGLSVIFLGMAMFALIRNRPIALVGGLLAPVILIGGAAIYAQAATVYDLPRAGAERLTPALPMSLSTALLLLIACSIGFAASASRSFNRIAVLLASVAAGLAAAPLALLLEPQYAELVQWHPFAIALPTALAALGFSTALLVHQSSLWWPSAQLHHQQRSDWRHLRLLLPILLVPIVASLFELQSEHVEFFPPVAAQMVSMSFNLLVLGGLLFWASGQASRQHAELEDLTSALDTAPIILTDADGRIRHWSAGCEQLYGWPAAVAVGRYKDELLPSRVAAEAALSDMSARDLTQRRRDGTIVHTVERLRRVEHADGSATLIYTMTDITDRVRAEAALRESEERLALATSAHPIGIFDADAKNDLRWMPGSDARLGVPLEVLESPELRTRYIPAADLRVMRAKIAAAIARRADRISVSAPFELPGEPEREMQIAMRFFYDADGRHRRTVGIVIDQTERYQREKALATREAQLRSILATVPDAMIVMDADGIIRTFSHAAETLFGYTADDAIGLHISTLLSEVAGFGQNLGARGDGGQHFRNAINSVRPFMARRADGGEVPIELRIGEAVIGEEKLLTAVARDISGRLKNEARIATLRHALNRTARLNAVSEMAAGIAHELNQPLAAVVNFLGTATVLQQKNAAPERIADLLKHASTEAMRAGAIIRGLREFIARREAERTIEPVGPTIREAAELALAGQGQRRASVRYWFEPAATHILADRVQIQQVIVNLVRNALDAMEIANPSRREIRIATHIADEDMVRISIADTGPGIPETMVGRLFQPFVTTKSEAGMGIGLAICRGIIEDHGGVLTAENRAGGGALFAFTVPLASEAERTLE